MSTLTVTLSASVDSGESCLTPRARRTLEELHETHGALWAMDVLGDWRAELKTAYKNASIAFSASHPNSRRMSVESAALCILSRGGDPKDVDDAVLFCTNTIPPRHDAVEIVEYAHTDKYKKAVVREARKRASKIVDRILAGKADPVEADTDLDSMIHRAVAYGIIERISGQPAKEAAE